MELLKFIVEFRNYLRSHLEDDLFKFGYVKFFDNEILTNGDERNVFKLGFKGESILEVCQDDWRDYTEYFNLKINSKEVFVLNIMKYNNISEAYDSLFEEIKSKIIK